SALGYHLAHPPTVALESHVLRLLQQLRTGPPV
ncbi:hypothetical protein ACQWHU_25435, partial [Salmonella enterica subsp. enterica serovar Infantis]